MFFFRAKPQYSDGVIDLVPLNQQMPEADRDFGDVYDFLIVPHGKHREAGRISVRLGEGFAIYYFGHIGYHVDRPYRGQHYARRACALLQPLLERAGKSSVVITCDPDNWPSRKTCEGLGCVLERTVDVPPRLRARYDISLVKCRYVWRVSETPPMYGDASLSGTMNQTTEIEGN